MRILLFILIFMVFGIGKGVAQLVLHPVPNALLYTKHNDDYTVKVRLAGGDWQDLFEYNVKVDLDNAQNASMVQFDFNGKVEVMVKKNNGMLQTAAVRPLAANIMPVIEGNTLLFSIDKPQKLSIEFNGDRLTNLHLFANVLETEIFKADDPNVIYFGPGVHQPEDQPGIQFDIPSNKIVYLAAGAVLKGKLVCDKVENVRIMGRGIILEAQRGIEVTNSKNISIEGITVINPDHYTIYGGQTTGLSINNLKSFSCKGWSDGIDLMSCSDVKIEDVFMRNSDDCIAIYGHRWGFYGKAQNISVNNAVLWADVAHPINIGLHGNATQGGDTISNLRFTNIRILEHDEDDPNYQGCMAITCSDNNLVKDVQFENIDIDNIQEGQLFNIRILYNTKYCLAPGRGVENVLLKNITCRGYGLSRSLIEGYDNDRRVKGVTVQAFSLNGQEITNITEVAKVGAFAQDIKWRK